jgi:hypothetical protein
MARVHRHAHQPRVTKAPRLQSLKPLKPLTLSTPTHRCTTITSTDTTTTQ